MTATDIAQAAAADDLTYLAGSFSRSVRATRSKKTTEIYGSAVTHLETFLRNQGMPLTVRAIRREHLEAFFASLEARGWRPATRNQTYRSLVQFWKYLVQENEIRTSPMRNIRAPAIPDEPQSVVTADQMDKLLRTVTNQKKYADVRDRAILSLLYDAGLRLGELAGLQLGDVDTDSRTARVTGKAGHIRVVRFGPRTATALDRYELRRHRWINTRGRETRYGASQAFWIGEQGPMTRWGIDQLIRRRAEQAGLTGIHAHAFRHGFAHAYLAGGGEGGDLMRLAGWRSRSMLDRYAKSTAEERALANYDNFSPMERLR